MIKKLKKYIFYSLLMTEFLIFSYNYIFGKNGLYFLINLKKENKKDKNQIILIKDDILQLKRQIQDWDQDSFYKEKIAREKLQMSRGNEQIYYIF